MNKLMVRLTCHHMVRIPVNYDTALDVYCRYDGYKSIRNVYHREWHIWCGDCVFGRWVGQSQPQAARISSQHHRRNPGHRIYVEYDTVTQNGRGLLRDSDKVAPVFGVDRSLLQEEDRSCQQGTRAVDEPPPF